jgi:Domain of unknown function (DUF6268)
MKSKLTRRLSLNSAIALVALSTLLGDMAWADPVVDPTVLSSKADSQIGLSLSFKATTTDENEFKSSNTELGDISSDDFGFSLTQIIPVSDDDRITMGLSYEITEFDRTPRAGIPAIPVPETLQSLSLDLNYTHDFSDLWSTSLFLNPGMHSAGDSLSDDGLGLIGGFLVSYQFRPKLKLSLGAGFNTLAEDMRFFPAFGTEWESAGGDWSVALGFPSTGITYHFTEKFTLSLLVEGKGGAYHVEEDPAPKLAGKPSLRNSMVEYRDIRVGLEARYMMNEHLNLTATVGQAFNQKFNYEEQKYKVKADDATPYLSLGLNYSF